jgi:hypothetical protein
MSITPNNYTQDALRIAQELVTRYTERAVYEHTAAEAITAAVAEELRYMSTEDVKRWAASPYLSTYEDDAVAAHGEADDSEPGGFLRHHTVMGAVHMLMRDAVHREFLQQLNVADEELRTEISERQLMLGALRDAVQTL